MFKMTFSLQYFRTVVATEQVSDITPIVVALLIRFKLMLCILVFIFLKNQCCSLIWDLIGTIFFFMSVTYLLLHYFQVLHFDHVKCCGKDVEVK
jgi:hypothetical protein